MRASRWSFALYTMFGALLCATVTALWPTRAYADVFQIDLNESNLRLYDCYTSALGDETLGSDIGGYAYETFYRQVTDLEYQETVSLTYGTSSVTGWISPSTEYQETYWESNLFDGADSALNNPPLALFIPLGSTAIPRGYRFRVSFASTAWVLRYLNGSNYQNVSFAANVYRVFSGTSMSDLQECTYSEGGYVANKNSRIVVLVLNTTNRTGTRLLESHKYQLYSKLSFQIDIPDATAQEINDQSVINTEDINDTISTQTEAQTDQLKDTSGSDTVASDQADVGSQTMQNISFVNVLDTIGSSWRTAATSTESDSNFTFPGMQMMGFTVPTYTVDVWGLIPSLETPVKTVTTFVIIAMCLKYLYALVSVIFGLQDAELAASMAANGVPMEVDEVVTDAMGGDTWVPRYARPRRRNYWRRH